MLLSSSAVLFDLDGTLLPLDQDRFTKEYLSLLADALAPYGYEKGTFISAVLRGVAAMAANDGKRSNESVLFDSLVSSLGENIEKARPVFDRFYLTDFEQLRSLASPSEEAVALVRSLRARGIRTVLATSPVFPAAATRARMRWAGLSEEDFDFFTSYESSTYSKPNPAFYTEIAVRLGIPSEKCAMIGNDSEEDLAAKEAGMRVFLLTDRLVNRKGRDISLYPHGSFRDASVWLQGLSL